MCDVFYLFIYIIYIRYWYLFRVDFFDAFFTVAFIYLFYFYLPVLSTNCPFVRWPDTLRLILRGLLIIIVINRKRAFRNKKSVVAYQYSTIPSHVANQVANLTCILLKNIIENWIIAGFFFWYLSCKICVTMQTNDTLG